MKMTRNKVLLLERISSEALIMDNRFELLGSRIYNQRNQDIKISSRIISKYGGETDEVNLGEKKDNF